MRYLLRYGLAFGVLTGLMSGVLACHPDTGPQVWLEGSELDAITSTDTKAPKDVTTPKDTLAPADTSTPKDLTVPKDTAVTTDVATVDTAAPKDTTLTLDLTVPPDADTPPINGVGWSFDTDSEGWLVDYAVPEALAASTQIAFDPAAGLPTPGSLKATIPFTGALQEVDIAVPLAAPRNLTGKVLSARVVLDSGLGIGGEPGGVKLFVKTGENYIYADAGWVNLEHLGSWVTMTFPIDRPPGWVQPPSASGVYDPTDIRLIGVGVMTASNGSVDWGTAVVHIDSVKYADEIP